MPMEKLWVKMAGEKPDVLLVGSRKPVLVGGLEPKVTLHYLLEAKDQDAFIKSVGDKIRAIAVAYTANKVDANFLQRFPKLEQVSSFGVGYDHIDAKWAGAHGIIVTNTPEVLNEEVADTALGLLLCTVREFPQAERYLRAGKWPDKQYPLTKATLRNRTVGMVGMGRIGKAIAKRLEAFGVPVVYHSRNPQAGVAYKYYPKLLDMARDVDTLMVIVPGGAATANMINAEVLKALGPNGILINMARGSVVDEPALIAALKRSHDLFRRPRRLRQGAAGAEGTDGDGPHRAVPASRFLDRGDAGGDGPARGRQHPGLGGGQAAADAGAGNAVSAEKVNRHAPRISADRFAASLIGPAFGFDFEPVKPMDVKAVDPALLSDVYGTWEIRDKSGKRRCRIELKKDTAIGGNQVAVARGCDKAFLAGHRGMAAAAEAGPSIWSIRCARRACASRRRTIAMWRLARPPTSPAWTIF